MESGTAGILPVVKIAGLCLLFSNLFFVATQPCLGGQSSAQIRGMVLDPHGAVIMGATVDLLSLEKARTTETDDSGKFEFLDSPLSTYDLQVRNLFQRPFN
jgi:Carboxypeptidase regulatory-like domain